MGRKMEIFKKLLEKFKALLKKNGNKKIIEKAAIIALLGVMCLIAGSVLFEKDTANNKNSNTLFDVNTDSNNAKTGSEVKSQPNGEALETLGKADIDQKDEMEKKLQSILSKINGAGKVEVMITFYSGNEYVPATDVNASDNTTNEKDKEGGSREIKQTEKQNTTIYEENDGVKKPFIIKEVLPKVKGVVVVADGAADAEVKANLAKATEALLDVATHKIQVFQRGGN